MHYTPLRYPGGKTKLSPIIKAIIQENGLSNGTYIEPYSGGAGVALTLLLENVMKYIVINDIDPVIYAFWKTMLANPESFCKKIEDTPVSIEEWRKQQYINKNNSEFTIEEVGFSTFYLNRTNRSGIIKGGVIGGIKQEGAYKIDARFNKKNLIKRIERIAEYKDYISVNNYDALELIDKVKIHTPKKVLYYFDPPYYAKGQTLYKNFYTHKDHENVAKKIQKLKLPWIVTYDNISEIKQLYQSNNTTDFTINYYASKVTKATEVLFYNNLKLPVGIVHI